MATELACEVNWPSKSGRMMCAAGATVDNKPWGSEQFGESCSRHPEGSPRGPTLLLCLGFQVSGAKRWLVKSFRASRRVRSEPQRSKTEETQEAKCARAWQNLN